MRMKRRGLRRRAMAWLMVCMMITGGIPVQALAEDGTGYACTEADAAEPNSEETEEVSFSSESACPMAVTEEDADDSMSERSEQDAGNMPGEESGQDDGTAAAEESVQDGSPVEEPVEDGQEAGAETESPAEEITEEKVFLRDTYVYESPELTVTAVLAAASAIPDEAELRVTEIRENTKEYNYDAYMTALNQAGDEEYSSDNTLMYDVAFVGTDAEGQVVEYQPETGSVRVSFDFHRGQLGSMGAEASSRIEVMHLPLAESVTEAVNTTAEATEISAADITVETVRVQTIDVPEESLDILAKSFSAYTITVRTQDSEGVTIETPGGLPAGLGAAYIGKVFVDIYGGVSVTTKAGTPVLVPLAPGEGIELVEAEGWNPGAAEIAVKVGGSVNQYNQNTDKIYRSGDLMEIGEDFYTLNIGESGNTITVGFEEFELDPGAPFTFATALGPAINHGIVAESAEFGGDLETNAAVKTLTADTTVKGPGPRDAVNGGYTYIGEFTGTSLKWSNGEQNTNQMVIYTTQESIDNGLTVGGGVTINLSKDKETINQYVQDLLDEARNNSNTMFADPNQVSLSDVSYTGTEGNLREKTVIDIKKYSKGVPGSYYVKFEEGEYNDLSNYWIVLDEGQTVIFNIPDDHVTFKQVNMIYDDTAYNSDGYIIAIAQHLVLNCPNATVANSGGNADGTFLVPNADYDNSGVTGGWIVCKSFHNDPEWHMVYPSLPKTDPNVIDIRGEKTWDDAGHTDARPGYIVVKLMNGSTVADTRVVTAANGWKWSFTDMPVLEEGAYTIAEEAVEGYTTTVDDYNITNKYDGGEPEPPTEDEPYPVTISKRDILGEELEGADLKVTGREDGADEDIDEITWESQGEAKELSLKPGTYTLTEEAAPDGYTIATAITFTLNDDGSIVVGDVTLTGNTVAMVDDYESHPLTISKVDLLGEELEGADLKVTGREDGADEDIDEITWTSQGEAKELTLKPGTYTLTEENAPDNYVVATAIQFTVNVDGTVTVDDVTVEGNTIVMEDDYESHPLTISKVDLLGEELEGADMKVTGREDGADEDIDEITWTSQGEAKELTLKPGTYTLTEENAPDGYVVATAIEFTVNVDGTVTVDDVTVEGNTIVMEDDYESHPLTISKVDLLGEELEGADMKVTGREDGADEDIDEITWVSSGEAKELTLKPGTYTLTEENAPDNYVVATAIEFTVNVDGTVTVDDVTVEGNTIVMEDDYESHPLTISKVDLWGEELEGAELKVTGQEDGSDEEIDEITWTSQGEAKELSLKPGTYTLTETDAPEGYVVATAIQFTVNVDGTVTVDDVTVEGNTIVMEDAFETPHVKISKRDILGEELPGADLKVTGQEDGAEDEIEEITWTSGEEPEELTLNPGTYTLTETAAPEDYVVATAIQFTVNEDGTVTVDDVTVEGNTIVMVDDYEVPYVKISKVDIWGEELEGAELKVTGKEDGAEDEIEEITWTSGEEPKVLTLNPGTYTLTETAAPEDYVVATAIEFTVNEDGTVTVDDVTVEGNTIVMEDAFETPHVKISKVDLLGEELPDAHMKVTGQEDGSEDEIDEITWISGEEPKELTLKPGVYTLEEELAPEGYVVATDISFTVNEDGTVTVDDVTVEGNTIVMVDAYDTVTVTISKVDIWGEELEGADLKVTGQEDGSDEEIEEITWTSEGEAKELSLKPGTYTLTEEFAPEGYVVATEIEFTVNEDGTVTVDDVTVEGNTIVMEDAFETPHVKISKVDMLGEELPDAHMKVTGKEAETNEEIDEITWISGEEPKELTLKPGVYTLEEELAPDGYLVATDISFTVNEDGTVTVDDVTVEGNTIVMEDAYDTVTVTISKVDLWGEELPGADLKVTGQEDGSEDEIDEITWTSGEEAKELTLKPGTYTLTEEFAPEGYVVATAIEFTVEADGTVTVDDVTVEGNTIVMEDAFETPHVKISKVDLLGEELPDAHMKVTGTEAETNEEIDEITWTSGGEAKELTLKPGEYTLEEELAPEGYVVATSIRFTVNEDGTVAVDDVTVEGNTIVMVDDYDTVTVTISKVDIWGEELPGADLKVTGKEDGADENIDEITWTSGEEAKELALKPGEYTLTEEFAPEGYTVATDIRFTVNADGTVSVGDVTVTGNTIVMEDDYALESVTIEVEKTWDDEGNKYGVRPEDVTVKLLADGEDTGKTLTLNEDNDWKGTFEDLPKYEEGHKIEYTLEEVAVDSYSTDTQGDSEDGFHIHSTITEEAIEEWNNANDNSDINPEDEIPTTSDDSEDDADEKGGKDNKDKTESKGNSGTAPRTGDSSHAGLWLLMMMISGLAFRAVSVAGRKKRRIGR